VQTSARRSCALWLHRTARATLLVIALTSFAAPGTAVSAMVPAGGRGSSTARGWPSKSSIAAACFAAGSSGWRKRVIRPTRDEKNPDAVFRQRPLCGLTVPKGYSPLDSTTGAAARSTTPTTGRHTASPGKLHSADVSVARLYLGVPLFGETKTLLRVPRLRSEGLC
jgi:hypothetical protein